MTVFSMSRAEIDRLHVLRDVIGERISAREAAQLMRLTPRQVFRLLKIYRADGPSALLSKRRGKPSNRSYPSVVRTEALALIKANYADFGPTLAAEKLAERHGLRLGVETVRRWMLAEGIWKTADSVSSQSTNPDIAAIASASSFRSTGPSTGGSRTRSPVHPTRLYRRRDKSTDAPAICRVGIDVRLFSRGAHIFAALRQAGRFLFGQACDVPSDKRRERSAATA